MVFSERTQEAFNEQIRREVEASYTYLAMSEYFDALGLDGFSTWFENQSAEEWMHAMKFRTYVQDRGGRVRYRAIREPESDFSSELEVFERTLEHEQSVSQSIADLYALAVEEKVVRDIIDWLKRIGDSQEGLYLLDKQLGAGLASGGGSAPAEV